MNIPKDVFIIILQFAADYTKQDFLDHQKRLVPGINLINRIEQCWNDYIYDDLGEYIKHSRTIFQVIWYLDSIDTRSRLSIKWTKPIIKKLKSNQIVNSYNSFDREKLIVKY